jgi:hypothetical protein
MVFRILVLTTGKIYCRVPDINISPTDMTNRYLLIFSVHGDLLLMIIFLLGFYAMWIGARFSTFRVYMLPPSSVLYDIKINR